MQSRLTELLGNKVSVIDTLGGGRNSQVYLVAGAATEQYIVKRYFRHRSDPRERLQVEFSSLQFLWRNGVRSIPQPMVADLECGFAVYEFLDGDQIASEEVSTDDIDRAIEFLIQLEALKHKKEPGSFPVASEACFSVQAVVRNIELRLQRLTTLRNREAPYDALKEFLQQEFIPAMNRISTWCLACLKTMELSFTRELSDQERTLSPSDFGFHNALRRRDGRIAFLDFEYFGWDDPAKMIVDFLLHPAMDLHESLKRRFVRRMLHGFSHHAMLPTRVAMVYPLFGLKWCLILLNEFVPESLYRRRFASGIHVATCSLLAVQLAKARRMLHRTVCHYDHFPYYG